MKQSLHVAGWTEASGGGGGLVGGLAALAVVGVMVLVAAIVFLAQVRETVSALSPDVRAAQAQAQAAEANAHAAEVNRQARAAAADQATADAWRPWRIGAENLAVITLLVAVPVVLLLVAIAAVAMVKRRLSLPTVDGRVPIVGLDRELSREALERYQQLVAARTATWSPLPAEMLSSSPPAAAREDRKVLTVSREEP